jgi:hypothetical protein
MLRSTRTPTKPDSSRVRDLPSMAEIAAFRVYLQGIDPKTCAERFIQERLGRGRNARGVLSAIRRSLVVSVKQRHRLDWADRLIAITPQSPQRVYREADTILRELPSTPIPLPQLDDSVTAWINERAANALMSSACYESGFFG